MFLIVDHAHGGHDLLMWMGELITQRGIGNGISLMIFASIVARPPERRPGLVDQPGPGLHGDDAVHRAGRDRGIVFIQEGQRRIPVQYAKRVIGRRMTQRRLDLPAAARQHGRRHPGHLRRVDHGVPADGRPAQPSRWAQDVATFFNPNGWAFVVGETFFIIIFTYFYTAVTFNPVDQADNLKKYGGFIPGVRPGRPTAEFLDRILARLTFPGALFLAAVAALPTLLISQTSANFFFGGTSLLIVIGVALDTMKQLEAQLMMRNYEGFLK